MRDTRVAGIWKSDVKRQLLWRRYRLVREAQKMYIAPSWSWTSRPDGGNASGLLRGLGCPGIWRYWCLPLAFHWQARSHSHSDWE
ncbi:hypothetical protein BDZ45DRAFT_504049 [Acephala macrosclerotiorum]|nr:hypothetical protein BDZ45DRAFT_504049 [Acephala macrosclerotiorum]